MRKSRGLGDDLGNQNNRDQIVMEDFAQILGWVLGTAVAAFIVFALWKSIGVFVRSLRKDDAPRTISIRSWWSWRGYLIVFSIMIALQLIRLLGAPSS